MAAPVLHGERKVEARNFGYETNFSAIEETSVSESVATIRTNVSIFGECEIVRGKTKVKFSDFLGIGDHK
ncbi:hypothetical protein TSUD_146340 [Trifolium subterraneum]|uniref:Uncharacterized protein n=1 Tax=Trifolium subterraneum TaxID=3900 RepID=A0A2Z6NP92_TRISU|nr:hypothetical protein TSUD_146340 [Trifolium subterraneum]